MRGLRSTLLLLVLPLALVCAALLFLAATEGGLRLLVGAGVRAAGGMLAVEEVEGRLLDRWRLGGLRLETPDVAITLERVEGEWQPLSLLQGEVRCLTLRGAGAEVRIKENGPDENWTPPARFLLPVVVVLEDLELTDLRIFDDDEAIWPPFRKITLTAEARSGHLVVQRCDAAMDGAEAHLQGTLTLGDGWPLDARGSWRIEESLVGAPWGPWSADMVIRGTLERPQATVDLQTPTLGQATLAVSEPFGELRWQAEGEMAGGALAQELADRLGLTLEKVGMQASGTLDIYQGTVRLTGLRPPGVTVHLDGELSGDGDGLKVSALRVGAEQGGRQLGTVAGTGAVSWRQDLQWQAELSGREVDPGLIFPQWQGLLDARLTTVGHLRDGAVEGEVVLAALEGELLGHPLSGGGRLRMAGETLTLDDLHLRSGESEVWAQGTMAEAVDLRLEADIVDLGDFLPDAGGAATLHLTAQGTPDVPALSLEFKGDGLWYQDLRLQDVQGSATGSLDPAGTVEAHVDGRGLRVQEHLFSELHGALVGSVADHRLELSLQGEEEQLSLGLAGGLHEGQWRGAVQQTRLVLPRFGPWQLASPASLRVDVAGVDLGATCLQQGETAVCAEGRWQAEGGQWQIKADLDDLDCQQFARWELLSRPLAGTLTASLQGNGAGTRVEQGVAQVIVPELTVVAQDEEGHEQRLLWHENRLSLEVAEGRLVGMLKARFQEESAVDASLVVSGFGDLAAPWEGLPIQGEIDLHLSDLTPVAVLADYAVRPTGALSGAFKVQGLLGSPRLSGELRQTSGDIAVPLLGITLEDLLLSAMIRGDGERMSVTLDLQSGPGSARMEAEIEHGAQGWQMETRITGTNFEVANTAGYELRLDPDLAVALHEGVVQVSGRVRIPRAVIVGDALNHAVVASSDVIFIDGKEEKRINWPVVGTVQVELGDDFSVDAFDIKGRVLGSVAITFSPGRPPAGQGNLTLEDGVYLMKDRALGITRGRFFLTGGPLDNPGIDVLAQTKSRNKTVGVMVTGTVQDMELKLFSDPPMPENAILVELLAGRSYSDTGHRVSSTLGTVASGIGLGQGGGFVENILGRLEDQFALNNIYVESDDDLYHSDDDLDSATVTIGKNIFEKLYVSYGYDPVRSTGVFRVRYDLWGGFSVETEVGDDRTGADLLWSFERP